MKTREVGFTIMEVLVSLTISGALLSSLVMQFASVSKYSRDLAIKAEVRETLRSLFEIISSDIRNAGSGMPIGLSNFKTTTAGVSDYALPIFTSSSGATIQLRLCVNGKSDLTTALYDNLLTSKELSLMSTSGFKLNDKIYLSELTSGGTTGMYANIASVVSGVKLTLSDVVMPTGVTAIRASSQASVVSDISIQYDSSLSSITRTTPTGTITLAPRSVVAFTYLNTSGAVISPLTSSNIANSLAAIGTTITVNGSKNLSTGLAYSETKTLNIVLRNILNNR